MREAIVWFDSLDVTAVAAVAVLLFLLEPTVRKLTISGRAKKITLINCWQLFGVLFPAFWLLRCAEGYLEATFAVVVTVFFGVYKPTKAKFENA